ncbi:TIR domain-containing protein [Streptomyces sp. NPDC051738]|uniref:TIR domain-containing protein n=1 Tax=Streptomyces sp. NPDC051738 TaxID=3365672 RepID=UPI0037D8E9A6
MTAPVPPGAAVEDPPPVPHWFFTGYSDVRANFPLVERFHNDVQHRVKMMLGNAVPGAGFVDFKDIIPGEYWEKRVVEHGVCTARAMLALYSPSYFQSHWCAHEWTVFNARLGRFRREDARCLIGVLWQRGGRKWPAAVTAAQYVTLGDPESIYEQAGLYYIVPRGNEPVREEYERLVNKVAGLVVGAHAAALEPLKADGVDKLRPVFGAESDLSVDCVLAYADRDTDRRWGEWAYAQLAERRDVDVLPAECFGRAPARLLRSSLRRAQRVVVLLSRNSLTDPCLHRTVLEEIYADRELAPDLPRLIPMFIEPVPEEETPAGLAPGDGNALYDIPDLHAKREILLSAVSKPVLAPAVARRPPPPEPQNAVSHFERTLVDKLSQASSLMDDDIRRVWFEATGLDPAEEPESRWPTRIWLLSVVRVARKLPDGYTRLALALEAIDSESPESVEVRKLVDGHEPGPED